jgi:hypothetical protein
MGQSPSGELTVTLPPKKFSISYEAQEFVAFEFLAAVTSGL